MSKKKYETNPDYIYTSEADEDTLDLKEETKKERKNLINLLRGDEDR